MERRRLLLLAVAVLAATLGVAAVFAYARGADERAARQFDTVQVLGASAEIAAGESITDAAEAGKIDEIWVSQSQVLDGAVTDIGDLDGQRALTRIYPGEQLIQEKFGGAGDVQASTDLAIPTGLTAIAVTVEDDARVGDFITPGARVAVFLTRQGQSSRVLLENVQVLAVGLDTTVAGDESGQQGQTSLLTLALSQRDVERVRYGETVGTLSVALLNDESKVQADEGVDDSNVFE